MHPRRVLAGHDAPGVQHPGGALPSQMQDDLNGTGHLGVHGGRSQVGQRAERDQPGDNILGGVRVKRAAPTLVPSVESGEQLAHLGPADLADDEPVGSHPQRLVPAQLRAGVPGLLGRVGDGWVGSQPEQGGMRGVGAGPGAHPVSVCRPGRLPPRTLRCVE